MPQEQFCTHMRLTEQSPNIQHVIESLEIGDEYSGNRYA